MRRRREGNYAVTAVRSTSTIAESNQKTSYMHPILAQMDAFYFDPRVEVVGKKVTKITNVN